MKYQLVVAIIPHSTDLLLVRRLWANFSEMSIIILIQKMPFKKLPVKFRPFVEASHVYKSC